MQMPPAKYPELDEIAGYTLPFYDGNGAEHAHYLIEMSFKRPIMYLLFYRWWVPGLLSAVERKRLEQYDFSMLRRSYWAEFSLYHPVQFMLLLFAHRAFQFCVKFLIKPLAAPVQKLHSWFQFYRGVRAEGAGELHTHDDGNVDNELTCQRDNVPAQ